MAAPARSSRAAAGVALIVAGALLLVSVASGPLGVPALGWLVVGAWFAIAAAFVLLVIAADEVAARIALVIGAVGWLLLALSEAGMGPMGGLAGGGAVAAALGGLVGAIVLAVRRALPRRTAIAFVVTTALVAVLLLGAQVGLGIAVLTTILTLLFAAALVVTGVLLSGARVPGSR